MTKPQILQLMTKTRASYMKSLSNMDLVNPKLSMMLTSLDWSKMLADMLELKLKKQRHMLTTTMPLKMPSNKAAFCSNESFSPTTQVLGKKKFLYVESSAGATEL